MGKYGGVSAVNRSYFGGERARRAAAVYGPRVSGLVAGCVAVERVFKKVRDEGIGSGGGGFELLV